MFVNKAAVLLSYHICGQSKIWISYRKDKLLGDTLTVIGPPWPHSSRRAQRWWWGGEGWGRRSTWSRTTRPRPPSWSRFSENNKKRSCDTTSGWAPSDCWLVHVIVPTKKLSARYMGGQNVRLYSIAAFRIQLHTVQSISHKKWWSMNLLKKYFLFNRILIF